jgi:hypothetical protein
VARVVCEQIDQEPYPNQREEKKINQDKKGVKNKKGKKIGSTFPWIRKRAVEPPFTTWPGGSDRA